MRNATSFLLIFFFKVIPPLDNYIIKTQKVQQISIFWGWILCASWFFDRSERLRKIGVARDFGGQQRLSRRCCRVDEHFCYCKNCSHLNAFSHTKQKTTLLGGFCFGGRRWIRTTEAESNRFTVCPLWPLGNSPIFIFNASTIIAYHIFSVKPNFRKKQKNKKSALRDFP